MIRATIVALILAATVTSAHAHNPYIEPARSQQIAPADVAGAHKVGDPGFASEAIYGRLGEPGEVDLYVFTPATAEMLPFEILVPTRASLAAFHPTLALIAQGLPAPTSGELPVHLPAGYGIRIITDRGAQMRPTFFEPFSMERYWRGGRGIVEVPAGVPAYIAVFDAAGRTGDYVVGAGTVENFSAISFAEIVSAIVGLKLGLVGGRNSPWPDLAGVVLTVVGFALAFGRTAFGFLALAHGPLTTDGAGRTLEAQSMANWLVAGLLIIALGAIALYRVNGIAGVGVFQGLIGIALLCLWQFLRRGRGRWGTMFGALLTLALLLALMTLFAWHITVLA